MEKIIARRGLIKTIKTEYDNMNNISQYGRISIFKDSRGVLAIHTTIYSAK